MKLGLIIMVLIGLVLASNPSEAQTFSSVRECGSVNLMDWGSKISSFGKCLIAKFESDRESEYRMTGKVSSSYPWEPDDQNSIEPYESGDLLQSYFDMYRVSTQTFWLDEMIEGGSQLLKHRDSVLKRTHYLNEFAPAWQNLDYKLIEPSFTGHIFTPLMAFASEVLTRNSALKQLIYTDSSGTTQTYEQWANTFANAFAQAFAFHRRQGHLVVQYSNGAINQAYFKYPNLTGAAVPKEAKPLSDATLPVNMNSDMFTALLYMHEIQQVRAPAGDYNRTYYRLLVSGYINYLLTRPVLRFAPSTVGEILVWNYSERVGATRMEDVGHSNVVMRFFMQVYNRSLAPGLSRRHILALENTAKNLVLNQLAVLNKDPAGTTTYIRDKYGNIIGTTTTYINTLLDGSRSTPMGKLYHTSFAFAYAIRSSTFPKQQLADIQSARSAGGSKAGLRSLGPLSLGVRGMNLQP